MRKSLTLLVLILALVPCLLAVGDRRPGHTYSIVAIDKATGELGAAVQSHWFSFGTNVIWAESGSTKPTTS